jgi:serine/threonine protein kinase
LLLSREHVETLKEGDRLNVELQAQVVALQDGRTQVDRLNDELQRQVLDRSRQLFAALALVGRGAIVPVLKDGDVVQDRYRVVRQVGVGGMGAVYEVVRIKDGRRFAMKLATKVEGQGLARLAREAEFAASLRHDNIVGVIDVDVASAGYLFLVMEFIDGQTLGELIEAQVSAHEGLLLLADICAGLAALHAVGIVHRDVKPANIMIEPTGLEGGPAKRARLMDFGISRLAGPIDGVAGASTSMGSTSQAPSKSISTSISATTSKTSLPRAGATTAELIAQQMMAVDDSSDDDDGDGDDVTLAMGGDATTPMLTRRDLEKADRTSQPRVPRLAGHAATPGSAPLTEFGHVIGTPLYMAPELGLGGTAVTPSADVFAVGVIAHEVLAGALPFFEAPALCVLRGEAVPTPLGLAAARPGLPEAVVTAIDRCLLEDPSRRPSAAALAELLRAAASELRHEASRSSSSLGGSFP